MRRWSRVALATQMLAVLAPLVPGGHPVAEVGYTLGDEVFHHGPYPLVVPLHGRHATCVTPGQPSPDGSWPCAPGSTSIPSYLGYGDLGRSPACHGYAVISISASGAAKVWSTW